MSDEKESVFAKINREVDELKRGRESAGCDDIWDDLSVWAEIGRDSDGLRPVEDFVFAYYAHLARRASPTLRDTYTTESLMDAVSGVWREIIAEYDADNPPRIVTPELPNHYLPLREVMSKRGTELQWLDLGRDMMTGRKSVTAVEVKIGARKRSKK